MERCEESTFFQTRNVGDSRSIATKNICPGEIDCGHIPKKQSASICRQVCCVKHQSDNLFE